MSGNALEAVLNLDGFQKIPRMEFRRAPLRKAFRRAGQSVAKAAKRKISGRLAGAGNYPSKRTGRMVRSLRVRVSRPGLLVKVYHEKRADMTDFYPAFLHYGTSRGLRARDNWIADALADHADDIRARLRDGLLEALA